MHRIVSLIFFLFFFIIPNAESKLINGAANFDDAGIVRKTSFEKGGPLPGWAQPLTAVPYTSRTDPVVVRLSESQVQLGTESAVLYNRAIQVNERSSLSKIGQFSIIYYPVYQKLKLHRVALLRAGQTIDKISTVNIRHLQRETGMEAGMYGGATTVELLLDDVRVGDTLLVTYTIEGDNPVFGNRWHSNFSFEGSDPIELRKVSFSYPVNRKIYWRQLGDFRKTAIASQDEIVKGQHILKFEAAGIDAVEFEQATPSDFVPIRILQVSEYPDWQNVAQWADSLFPAVKSSPKLSALAKDFSSLPTPEEKVAAALHWVQNEVRYFSVSIGENSHRPQTPDTVISRRYGDCKDKSYLLVALLTQLGIEARPMLIASEEPKLPVKVLPSPFWFDHVIVRVIVNGRQYFVDPTNAGQLAPLEKLPVAMHGAFGLIVNKSTQDLTQIPENKDIGPLFEHDEHIKLTQFDGDAVLDMVDTYQGTYADWARDRYSNMSESELKKDILEYFEKNYPAVSLTGEPVLKDDVAQNVFSVVAHLTLTKPVQITKESYKLAYNSQILKGSVTVPDKLVRAFPLEFRTNNYAGRFRLTIEWPESVRYNLSPNYEVVDNPFFRLEDGYSFDGNLTSYMLDFKTRQKDVSPADIPELNKQVKAIEDFTSGSINVRKANVSTVNAKDLSFRTYDEAVTISGFVNFMKNFEKKGDTETSVGEMCKTVSQLYAYKGLFESEVFAKLDSISGEESATQTDDDKYCMASVLFARGRYAAGEKAAATIEKIESDDTLNRQSAWAQFYNGDLNGATDKIDRYVQAVTASKYASINTFEIVDQIALYQRAGRELTREMKNFAASLPDGPWPRPIAAMQTDLISPEALLAQLESLPPTTREIELADAWYYLGQKYLSQNNLKEAVVALKHVRMSGIRSRDYYLQALNELDELEVKIADISEGNASYDKKDTATALASWKLAAEKNNPAAEMRIGDFYNPVDGDVKDAAQAFYWYQRAAEHGDEGGQFHIAFMYDIGEGTEKDPEKSLYWMNLSAAKGYGRALTNLAWDYRTGTNVKQDFAEALRLYKLAADQGRTTAICALSTMYLNEFGEAKNYALAFFWAQLGSAKKNAVCQDSLGYIYENGLGVEKNMKAAKDNYSLAAEQGNADAQANLGNFYRFGDVVEPDLPKAMNLYRKAAQQGNLQAQFNIGWMYEFGLSVGMDMVEAHKWYKLAADNGHKFAQYRLGVWSERGIGGSKNMQEAISWYAKAAESGHPDAAFDLGYIYQYGDGVPADVSEAMKWFRMSATAGNVVAQNSLGLIYLDRGQLPSDKIEATRWFKAAAESGSLDGQNNFAIMLNEGSGTDIDKFGAYKWWTIVKLQAKPGSENDQSATQGLADLSKVLSEEDKTKLRASASEWLDVHSAKK